MTKGSDAVHNARIINRNNRPELKRDCDTVRYGSRTRGKAQSNNRPELKRDCDENFASGDDARAYNVIIDLN